MFLGILCMRIILLLVLFWYWLSIFSTFWYCFKTYQRNKMAGVSLMLLDKFWIYTNAHVQITILELSNIKNKPVFWLVRNPWAVIGYELSQSAFKKSYFIAQSKGCLLGVVIRGCLFEIYLKYFQWKVINLNNVLIVGPLICPPVPHDNRTIIITCSVVHDLFE